MENDTLHEISAGFGLAEPERFDLWRGRLEEDREAVELLRSVDLVDDQALVRLDDLTERQPRAPRVPDAQEQRAGAGPVSFGDRTWRASQSVTERVGAALAAIGAASHLNAFTAVFAEEALAAASLLDERRAAGEETGPLTGCIVAVKDLIDVEGYRTTGGTKALQRPTAERDAPSVARLRAAGAVVVGTANLHALAYGALSTSSDAGVVGNPLREEAIAGGSSGGSAAAVGAGLVDIALGTDTAGSIRIPASLCGAVGLKPTYGRIPTTGVQALGPSLDHVGPITHTVAQAAHCLEAMSDQSFNAAAACWSTLDGVTVGVPRTYFMEHLHASVRRAVESALVAAEQLGATVVEVDLPSAGLSPGIQLCTLSPEAFDVHRELLRDRGHLLPDDVRLRLEVGMFRTGADYVRAQRLRGLLQKEMDDALTEADVLLVPTLPVTAPPRGLSRVEVETQHWTTQAAMTRLTMPFNLTGFPALSLPWAADPGGSSIGIQLAARPMDETTLLGAAHAMEQHRDG